VVRLATMENKHRAAARFALEAMALLCSTCRDRGVGDVLGHTFASAIVRWAAPAQSVVMWLSSNRVHKEVESGGLAAFLTRAALNYLSRCTSQRCSLAAAALMSAEEDPRLGMMMGALEFTCEVLSAFGSRCVGRDPPLMLQCAAVVAHAAAQLHFPEQ